jgi:hypothetical protein
MRCLALLSLALGAGCVPTTDPAQSQDTPKPLPIVRSELLGEVPVSEDGSNIQAEVIAQCVGFMEGAQRRVAIPDTPRGSHATAFNYAKKRASKRTDLMAHRTTGHLLVKEHWKLIDQGPDWTDDEYNLFQFTKSAGRVCSSVLINMAVYNMHLELDSRDQN